MSTTGLTVQQSDVVDIDSALERRATTGRRVEIEGQVDIVVGTSEGHAVRGLGAGVLQIAPGGVTTVDICGGPNAFQ